MKEEIEKFVGELQTSLADSSFIKLTLSNYKGAEPTLQRLSIRPVDLKKGRRLMFQYRYETRDVVKNIEFGDASAEVGLLIHSGFRSGHLFTTASDIQLTVGKKSARLTKGKATTNPSETATHNRQKTSLIDPNAFYLKALGISTDEGKIRSDQRDKWKQINKFVETVSGLIDNSSLKEKTELRIFDMGSGKGYLTFALYDFLEKSGRSGIRMTGVELRPDLVALCNNVAKAGGFDGLDFVEGSIAGTDLGAADILIALHACDTATDDALYKGIAANAEIVVAAPCCHKELKGQMKSPELLAGVLKHPVLFERTAETLTDGIRSMLLESRGYKTKMFEFVATEHTPKNNLLVATKQERTNDTVDFRDQISKIRDAFSFEHLRLAELLEED